MGLSNSQIEAEFNCFEHPDHQLGSLLFVPYFQVKSSMVCKTVNPSSPPSKCHAFGPLDGLNRIPAWRCIQWCFFPGSGRPEGIFF